MSTIPIHRREFHAFLSHAHADRSIVDRLHAWLRNQAGIPIWYDGHHLPGGTMIGTYLPQAIDKTRAMILVLSQASVRSGWVLEEYNAAIGQGTQFKGFRIIPVLIEQCEVPGFLQTTKWIEMLDGEIDLEPAYELLAALYYGDATLEPDLRKAQDIYVSRTWRSSEAHLADQVCQLLDEYMFRLIGDAQDQAGFQEGKRVESIISSCGGLVAILPDRGGGGTSKYMLQEIEIARNLGLPYLVVAEPTVEVPEHLAEATIRMVADDVESDRPGEAKLRQRIEALADSWRPPAHPHYVFFSTDLEEEFGRRNQVVRNAIQLITAMECRMGDRIRRPGIQQVISQQISGAFMMIADISDNNLNTCIEAGIARGAGTSLHLVAKEPRQRPPFMLSDYQVFHYASSLDLLGIIHDLAYPYRRRVLNYEVRK